MPKEVITPAYELKDDGLNLAEFATVENVSMGSGSLPIVPADDTTTLVTKTEAEELSDTDLALKEVEYKVETRAGRIIISDLNISFFSFVFVIKLLVSTLTLVSG